MSKVKKAVKETPLMGQYNKIKAKYPDAILLFRVGDFYETFGEDAIKTANVLGIVLTKRANGKAAHIELAGFPHHAVDTYLPKLVRAGYRVAICEQLEDPKKTKQIVKRGVTEMVTPGLAINDKILDNRSNNYLGSIYFGNKTHGISFIDVSTGAFYVSEGNIDYIKNLLQKFQPAELLFNKAQQKTFHQELKNNFHNFGLEDWVFTTEYANNKLANLFDTASLKGFGVDVLNEGLIAAGSIVQYLGETEHNQLKHINKISRLAPENSVWLDQFTIKNLELLRPNNVNGKALIDVIDQTISSMGSRMMKLWLVNPLKEKEAIEQRHKAVEIFIKNGAKAGDIRSFIHQIGDLERLVSKIALSKVNPRELLQLKSSLDTIAPLKKLLKQLKEPYLKHNEQLLDECKQCISTIENSLNEEAPAQLNKGNIIKDGVSKPLDELKTISNNGKEYLLQLQNKEIENTGITSLKIGFNNVFGYYLEVKNSHKDKVPEEWVRKQTLTNAERYITDELKQYEEKILGADDKIKKLELELYVQLVQDMLNYIAPLQQNAKVIARLDCLLCFAEISLANNYRKPIITNDSDLQIIEGRHPVIEAQLPPEESYIPNDVTLNDNNQQIVMITGPNMAGKSAILRQTALISIMAQIGCFVPAKKAKLGILDKIFTRVGATDNISSGESTFMVEMNETASIINNLSSRSLILLDEIGRGTSTYDGISIAWSVVEHLHNHPHKPKTLFATHYHELNELSKKFDGIKNYNVSTKELNNKVIFLRKLVAGGTQHSFGIHVAKMAGMPNTLINRANAILKELERKSINSDLKQKVAAVQPINYQLSMFGMDDPRMKKIMEMLNDIDVNAITPVEALLKIQALKDATEE